ncbi:unnamed protein product [Coffea canephora]|uniref:Uncharacterized protein n=1 Tax=Coffea canephora TaxID=49390 RepID=A0A068UDI2_COFCA|nr:unnamed protein product [Coffea canephora]
MKRTRRRVLMRTMLKIKKMIRLAHGTAIQGLELQGVKVWVVVSLPLVSVTKKRKVGVSTGEYKDISSW